MLVFLTALFAANAYQPVFEKATLAYEAKNYEEAAQLFSQIAAEDVDAGEVYYNLGNAFFRLGQLPRAIACYEIALGKDPTLESARENLATCVTLTTNKLPRPLGPAWQRALLFWHDYLPRATVYTLAVLSWCLFWALLIARCFRPLPYFRILACVLLLSSAAFATSTLVKGRPQPLAVAASDVVPIRYGKSDEETVRFELASGDRVVIERMEGDWMRVSTAGGKRGWGKVSSFVLASSRDVLYSEPESTEGS